MCLVSRIMNNCNFPNCRSNEVQLIKLTCDCEIHSACLENWLSSSNIECICGLIIKTGTFNGYLQLHDGFDNGWYFVMVFDSIDIMSLWSKLVVLESKTLRQATSIYFYFIHTCYSNETKTLIQVLTDRTVESVKSLDSSRKYTENINET